MVLERGEVANSWRRERWDSLRLLTPNWQSRLPGYRYDGADPDGYMTMGEVIDFISRFAVVSAAPVRTNTAVHSVRQTDGGYHIATNNGDFHCRTVPLHARGNQQNFHAMKSPGRHLQKVVNCCAGGTRHKTDAPRKHRQRPLARRIE